MASLASRLFLAVLFLIMFDAGWCQQCSLSDIKVTQKGTGRYIHGKLEYQVVVANDCICTQLNVRLTADGFQTTEGLDPTIFRQDGDTYILNDGQPIHSSETITFNYAWDNRFPFVPVSSQIACS